MGDIHDLRLRAERCRSTGYETPVVANVEEALQLARRIAAQMASLSGRETLLCMASLQDVQAALAARVARLQGEMAETRVQLERAQQAGRACRYYVVARKREG
jgi:hypothetical protein